MILFTLPWSASTTSAGTFVTTEVLVKPVLGFVVKIRFGSAISHVTDLTQYLKVRTMELFLIFQGLISSCFPWENIFLLSFWLSWCHHFLPSPKESQFPQTPPLYALS